MTERNTSWNRALLELFKTFYERRNPKKNRKGCSAFIHWLKSSGMTAHSG
jgi:hypothetical protein